MGWLPDDVYHRGPCCWCKRCGGHECYVLNPARAPGSSELHLCATCDFWVLRYIGNGASGAEAA